MENKLVYTYIRYKKKDKQYVLFIAKDIDANEVEICFITPFEFEKFIKFGIPQKADID